MNSILKTIGKRMPIMAAVLGAGLAMAQTTVHRNADSLYWYVRNSSGNYAFDHQGTDPTVNCQGVDQICAKGFTTTQDASLISDGTTSQDTRYKDE